MKRICIFYHRADNWVADRIQINWIVCKECQKKVNIGRRRALMRKAIQGR